MPEGRIHHRGATRRSRNQSLVLVLVVVLVLESAGCAEQNCQLMYNAKSLGTVEYCRRQWEAVGTPAGKQRMLVRIVAMHRKLVERFDPYQYRVRENAPSVAGPFEHE